MLALLSALTSFIVTIVSIPSLIKIAEIKNLVDFPEERKSHTKKISRLGGIGIYAGLSLSLGFWSTQVEIVELQYIMTSISVLFFMGMKDDLFDLVAWKKLVGQVLVSFIIVHFAEIRINTLYGLFGVYEISLVESYVLSIFTLIVIMNSYNLIDGIDGLAASSGVFSAACMGSWFFVIGSFQYAILASALVGTLLAFLWFNWSPAKIFMGDTGSLIIGVSVGILSFKFIEMNRVLPIDHDYKILSVPVVTMGIILLPLIDTLRVFFIRIGTGRSPFKADRNHLHHVFLELGFSHGQTTAILMTTNILVASFMYLFQEWRGEILLCVLIITCLTLTHLLNHFLIRKRSRTS